MTGPDDGGGKVLVPADNSAIDRMLGAMLRGGLAADAQPFFAADDNGDVVFERINYHGIAGLLHEKPEALTGFCDAVVAHVRGAAVSRAMWELRHRQLLNGLLAGLATANVVAIFLKGTALAYDLYTAPAARARGDSDLLVYPGDLAKVRLVFERLGFERTSGGDKADAFYLQEVWSKTCEGAMAHHIDLHWQTLNSPALEEVLPVADCAANRIPLPHLGPDAMAMDRVRMLIHTCIHRTLNFTSPYFVGDRTYYGGNRLIWLNDIDLLARALSEAEWDTFVRLATGKGVASACLDGLLTTQHVLATPVPTSVRVSLGRASTASRPAAYLRAHQLGRAWQDLRAMPSLRQKYGYFLSRALPSAKFVRDKYPHQARLPLPLLYARRLFDLFRARPTQRPER